MIIFTAQDSTGTWLKGMGSRASRFCSWIGAFQNYVIQINCPWKFCPEYCDAILIGAMNNKLSNGLAEPNIPGASLRNCEPEKFKITELWFWLEWWDAGRLSKLNMKANYVRQFALALRVHK